MPKDANWIVCKVPRSTLYPRELYDSDDFKKYNGKRTWEEELETAIRDLEITDAVWMPTKDDSKVTVCFPCDLDGIDAKLNYLQSRGIGLRKGTSIGLIPFSLYLEEEQSSDSDHSEDDDVFDLPEKLGHKKHNKLSGFRKVQEDFFKSITSRLTVAQVVSGVKHSSKVTFDFVMYTFFAGCIASCGIMNNSAVDIAAAMCIEPVMATVLVGAFGTVIHDYTLIKMGIRNNVIVIVECIVVGFLYGIIAMTWSIEWSPHEDIWPTEEMRTRGLLRSLWVGALQSSAAGGAVALSLLNNNYTALVGVAIASTFLPHVINTGLLWAYSCHLALRGMNEQDTLMNVTTMNGAKIEMKMKPSHAAIDAYIPVFHENMISESLKLSLISLTNCYINVLCLYIFCVLVLKLKEVAPLGSFEPNRKFFQEDIKAYRDYNYLRRKSGIPDEEKTTRGGDLGGQILREWADIAGLDPNVLLADTPAARVTQYHTLHDLASEVQNDRDYLSVAKAANAIPERNLVRRLTTCAIAPVTPQVTTTITPAPTFTRGFDNFSFCPDGPSGEVKRDLETGSNRVNFAPRARSMTSISNSSSINSEYSRGLKPQQMERQRKASFLLRKSLQETVHSPYSVWPSMTNIPETSPMPVASVFPKSSRFTVSQVRQRPKTSTSSHLSVSSKN